MASAYEDRTGYGYAIGSVQPEETGDRVALARAAWRPAGRALSQTSNQTHGRVVVEFVPQKAYRRVQSNRLYDIAFDLIAVAPHESPGDGQAGVWL